MGGSVTSGCGVTLARSKSVSGGQVYGASTVGCGQPSSDATSAATSCEKTFGGSTGVASARRSVGPTMSITAATVVWTEGSGGSTPSYWPGVAATNAARCPPAEPPARTTCGDVPRKAATLFMNRTAILTSSTGAGKALCGTPSAS